MTHETRQPATDLFRKMKPVPPSSSLSLWGFGSTKFAFNYYLAVLFEIREALSLEGREVVSVRPWTVNIPVILDAVMTELEQDDFLTNFVKRVEGAKAERMKGLRNAEIVCKAVCVKDSDDEPIDEVRGELVDRINGEEPGLLTREECLRMIGGQS